MTKGATSMTEQLIPHYQAAKSLHVALHRFEEGIRKGAISFADYTTEPYKNTSKRRDVWYLTSEQIEEAGIVLRTQKYSELPQPEETRLGVTRRLYNFSLRAARLRLGLTAAQLGQRVGVSGNAVTHYENLRQYPSLERARAIADVLGVSVESIFADWLTEFKLERSPSILDDAHFSLEEALEAGISLPSLPGPEEGSEREALRAALQQAMADLTHREKAVLDLRFGLSSNGETLTLEETGKHFGVTTERARQIQARALRNLRKPRLARRLLDFVD